MTQSLSPEDKIQCRKIAFGNGFRVEPEVDQGWLKCESTVISTVIWLSVDEQRNWLVAVDSAKIAELVDCDPSTVSGPGVARFRFNLLEKCNQFVDQVYRVSPSTRTRLEERFKQASGHLSEETEIERSARQRIGQEILREYLLGHHNNTCALTGINSKELLIVSHIKPWAKCESDKERLDPDNCLLLSALWDAAFDKGLVTFDEKGCPVFSAKLTSESKKNLQWEHPAELNQNHLKYLAWHRENVFLR